MKVLLAGDHAGVALKEYLAGQIKAWGHDVEDLGPHSEESVDYPDYAQKLCEEMEAEGVLGILICGTGIGVSIAANKMSGIRAALCKTEFEAQMARQHNNANVLCLGARSVSQELNERIVKAFLAESFEGGRHGRRVDKIMALEAL